MTLTGVLLLTLVGLAYVIRAQEFTDGVRSFSSAIKEGEIETNKEVILFEIDEGPGFFTEMWFTGAALQDNTTVIRIYLDGNVKTPAIEFNLFLGHAIGCRGSQEVSQTPWHTEHFGHEADMGGLYNTYRIPFGSDGAIVTATTAGPGGLFWFIVRGLLNAPLVVDGFTLPNNTRLRLHRHDDVIIKPYAFLNLVEIKERSGWIYQVTIDANSTSFVYLEACFRLSVDGAETQFLSSGTEDFFLSAYYFDRGTFRADQSGLSCKAKPGQMSAYKFFAADPIFFRKSALLRWRGGETINDPKGCPTKAKPFRQRRDVDMINIPPQPPGSVKATTYTWVYEY